MLWELMTENVFADRTPTSWPAPTSGNGDAEKRSSISAYPQESSAQTTTRTTH